MRILVIEDQKKVAQALQEGLHRHGFEVTLAGNGEEGFFLLNSRGIDLLILDLGLPGRDGIEILKAIRNRQIGLPILILTARDSVEDKVLGLESGADDYLVKPFAFPEIVARIHVLLRRSHKRLESLLELGDLRLDLKTHSASRGSIHLSLTAREAVLLEYFLRNKDAVVSRDMLVRDVWKASERATPLDNVIDVHIAHLRRKIDGPFAIKLLHTIRGVGFILSLSKP